MGKFVIGQKVVILAGRTYPRRVGTVVADKNYGGKQLYDVQCNGEYVANVPEDQLDDFHADTAERLAKIIRGDEETSLGHLTRRNLEHLYLESLQRIVALEEALQPFASSSEEVRKVLQEGDAL